MARIGRHRLALVCAALATLLALGTLAYAEQTVTEPQETVERPAYNGNQRWREDWSGLAAVDREKTGDRFDRVKFVPLSKSGSVRLSFGGEVRARAEAWSNFGSVDDDGAFGLFRLRLHTELQAGSRFRVFVEGKSALSTDRGLAGGRRALDVDEIDLQEAFGEVRFPFDHDARLVLRLGRQVLLFGKQRLVSPLDWSNTRRTWDGATVALEVRGATITGFGSAYVPVKKYAFNTPDDETRFEGVYASIDSPGVDLYWLNLERNQAAFNGTSGVEDRHTLGARLFRDIGATPVRIDFEGAYQFGDMGAFGIQAFMVTGEVAFRGKPGPGRPAGHVGAGYASGDDEPGGDVQTFNQLFSLGHAYLGYIDAIGRQNIVDINGGFAVMLHKGTFKVEPLAFWVADTSDALYNPGGAAVRGGASSYVGTEIDVTYHYPFDRHLSMLLGYSRLFTGSFLADVGRDKDVDFGYASFQFIF